MREFDKETIEKVRRVSILDILASNGIEPIKQDLKGSWFFSPYRNEKTASFLVDKENRFFDFGVGEGGDVVQLVCRLKNINFVEAVNLLLSNDSFSFVCPTISNQVRQIPTHKIKSIKSLKNRVFLEYLKSRCLDIQISKVYLSEIYYTFENSDQEKQYFGIGMKNQSEGYEVKNCKSGQYYCLGSKDVTILQNENSKNWAVFEGMFDFLAFMSFYKNIQINSIILHTVGNTSKILNSIPADAKKVCLFLDNDLGGNKATTEIINHFSKDFEVKDCRNVYEGFKDFNEFLISKKNTFAQVQHCTEKEDTPTNTHTHQGIKDATIPPTENELEYLKEMYSFYSSVKSKEFQELAKFYYFVLGVGGFDVAMDRVSKELILNPDDLQLRTWYKLLTNDIQ